MMRGLGDFFVVLPLMQAVKEKHDKIVLGCSNGGGYPEFFNDHIGWFDQIISLDKLGANKKANRDVAKQMGEFCLTMRTILALCQL